MLSLEHKLIPASLHVHNLNPDLPWASLPIELQRELGPWPEHDGPALAGVSAFGIAGTNAHVVLQEAPLLAASIEPDDAPMYLLPVSAHTPEALRDRAHAYQSFLRDTSASLRDICHTASVRRTHHDHRLAIVGDSREALIEQLVAAERSEVHSGAATHPALPKIAFVFPGQGSQWLGMGRQLLEHEPVFRAALERFDQAMRPVGRLVADRSVDGG